MFSAKVISPELLSDTVSRLSYRMGSDRPWGLSLMQLVGQKWDMSKELSPKEDIRLHFREKQGIFSQSHPSDRPDGNIVILKSGLMGRGGFGNVYRAEINQEDGSKLPVAVKIVKGKSKLDRPDVGFLRELLTFWDQSSNPNCSEHMVCIYGAFFVSLGDCLPDEFHECIVMERMDGDITSLLERQALKKATLDEKMHFFVYLSLHMMYDLVLLHEDGYMHVDIKPENYLYRYDPEKQIYRIKIADVGLACSFDPEKYEKLKAKAESTKDTAMDVTPVFQYLFTMGCFVGGTRVFMSAEMLNLYKKQKKSEKNLVQPEHKELFELNDFYSLYLTRAIIFFSLDIDVKDPKISIYDATPIHELLAKPQGSYMEQLAQCTRVEMHFVNNKIPLPLIK